MARVSPIFLAAALAVSACGGSGNGGAGGAGGGRIGLGPIVDVVRPVDPGEVADPALVLWYDRPAGNWETQALPIGNGEIGGMVFGGTPVDRIQFNEKTLWEGSQTSFGAYQTFGDILITVPSAETVTNYRL